MARPPGGNRVIVGVLLVATAALSACSSPPKSIAPANLDIVCSGEGSPTVILVPGMDTPAEAFESLQAQIATDTRVCSYSRAGIGNSPAWPDDLPDPTAGTAADQLRATLEENEVPGPYVVLGWSYGGLVTQAFAQRHRDATVGVVLEDSSIIAMMDHEDFYIGTFAEGGRAIDLEKSYAELAELDLRDLPLVVLTRKQLDGFTEDELSWWRSEHGELAAGTTDSLHLIASDAGHAIHWDSEALVEKAVDTVVEAVRSGEPLAECDDFVWVPYGGECRVAGSQ